MRKEKQFVEINHTYFRCQICEKYNFWKNDILEDSEGDSRRRRNTNRAENRCRWKFTRRVGERGKLHYLPLSLESLNAKKGNISKHALYWIRYAPSRLPRHKIGIRGYTVGVSFRIKDKVYVLVMHWEESTLVETTWFSREIQFKIECYCFCSTLFGEFFSLIWTPMKWKRAE